MVGPALDRVRRNIIAGILAMIPIAVTIWIASLVVNFLVWLGRPAVLAAAAWIRRYSPDTAGILREYWFQSSMALVIMLVGLYLLGALASFVAGRRIIGLFDRIMERIPGIRVLYGAVRRMIEVLQQPFPEGQRVVLVRFPSEVTRAVGFITRTFTDSAGRRLAAVFVPTAPNPTSGFIVVAEIDDLTSLDWTADQAAQFIVSVGTSGPFPSGNRWPEPDEEAPKASASGADVRRQATVE